MFYLLIFLSGAAPPLDELPPIDDLPQIEDLGAVPDVTHEHLDNVADEENAQEKEGLEEEELVEREELQDEEQVCGEEQTGVLDETQEQKRWTKRAHQMLHTLNRELNKKKEVTFDKLSKGSSRKQAAYKFYTLLILNKEKAITVTQDGLYSKIAVEKGDKFEEMV